MAKNSFRWLPTHPTLPNVLKASGYVELNEPGDVKKAEADDFNLESGKWQWNGTAWVAFTPPPPPPSLFTALKLGMGLSVAQMNAMLVKYPLFAPAVQGQDWPMVTALIIQTHTALDITDAQYALIKQAVQQAGLNTLIVLP